MLLMLRLVKRCLKISLLLLRLQTILPLLRLLRLQTLLRMRLLLLRPML
jgi:hypothetical protein